MLNIARFSIVLVAFVASLTAVVWTTASTERAIGVRESDERETAHGMRDALLARESALRGYAVSRARRLPAAVRRGDRRHLRRPQIARARSRMRTTPSERALIAEQERLAERWAGIANDMIIRVKNGRPVSAEASDAGTDVIERFEAANEALVEEIAAESAAAHSDAIRRAVVLIVLLSAAFAAAGSLLLVTCPARRDAPSARPGRRTTPRSASSRRHCR